MFTVCYFVYLCSTCPVFLGIFPKASYSSTSLNETSAVSELDLLDSYSYRINGTSESSSTLFLKNGRLLDAFDDEYEGVVVNPEQLPSNPNVFASALRSSIDHWKIKVFSFMQFSLPLLSSLQEVLCSQPSEAFKKLSNCTFEAVNQTLYQPSSYMFRINVMSLFMS